MKTQNKPVDLTTRLCGVELKNPVMPASGTFGFGYEMSDWYDLDCLGAVVLKGTTREARFGNPTPRIAEAASGVLNAIGLQNPGVDAVLANEVPKLRECYNGVVIANVAGFSVDEYVFVAQKFDESDDIDLLEINISCPNVKHGGIAFGTNPKDAAKITSAVKTVAKKPVLIKLSPNVTDIAAIAAACEGAGADGLVLVNTFLGMRIEPRTGKPIVSTGKCGFSGPAIKPMALAMVHTVCATVNIPVVGVGGIADANDVLEFLSAGAVAVQVGSQNLVEPCVCRDIVATLPAVMAGYGLGSVEAARGRAQ